MIIGLIEGLFGLIKGIFSLVFGVVGGALGLVFGILGAVLGLLVIIGVFLVLPVLLLVAIFEARLLYSCHALSDNRFLSPTRKIQPQGAGSLIQCLEGYFVKT